MRNKPTLYGSLIAGIVLNFSVITGGKILPNTPITESYDKEEEVQLVDTVVATCYHPVPEQTDSSPFTTADMSHINKRHPEKHRWIAISRDLEKQGFHMGDTVNVQGTWVYDGIWVIHDRMNKRFQKRIDFLINKGMYLDKFTNVNLSKV